MLLDRISFFKFLVSHKSVFIFVIILVILLFASLGYEYFHGIYVDKNWKTKSYQLEQELTLSIQTKFETYESETFRSVEKIGQSRFLKEIFTKHQDTSRAIFFEFLLSNTAGDITLELSDRDKRTISWMGNRRPILDTVNLLPERNSFILEGAIYSYLIISIPIIENHSIVGYAVGKRLFDVNYPLNNRFINSNTFTSTFTSLLDVGAEFEVGQSHNSLRDTNWISVLLKNFNNKLIGVIYLQKPTLLGYGEESHQTMQSINNIFILIIISLLIYSLFRRLTTINVVYKIIIATICIWIFRYVLVWLNLPSSVIQIGVFDASKFASPFGYGIAKSPGDLFLSTVFLLVNIFVITFNSFLRPNTSQNIRYFSIYNQKILSFLIIALSAVLILLFIRGFAATIRSTVFDSTLSYNNPTTVIPSFELSIMLISLLLIALSLLLAVTGIMIMMNTLVKSQLKENQSPLTSWIIVSVIIMIGSILFGILQPNLLLNQTARLFFILTFIGISVLVWWFRENKRNIPIIKLSPLFVIISIILLLPLLDVTTQNSDRTHIELLATEIVRPEDSWLTFLVNKALDELSGSESQMILSSANAYDISKLAFMQWANSILSKQGNNCSVIYFNKKGENVSTFNIGTTSELKRERNVDSLLRIKNVYTEDRIQNGMTVKWYVGYSPIIDEQGIVIGSVHMELTSGKQAILRSDASEFLRNHAGDTFEPTYKSLILSEYAQGKLINTTSEEIPIERPLPLGIEERNLGGNGVWLIDVIDGKKYETYFFKGQQKQSTGSWFAISMESLGTRWYLYFYLRYLVFYLILFLLIAVIITLIQFIRGKHYYSSFSTKLLWAFIFASLAPLLILAYNNRQYAMDRAVESTIKRLSDQTFIITSEIQKRYGINVPVTLSQFTDNQCSEVAGDLNTDFNVYYFSTIQASSKPEMFEAELLDPSLSTEAYLNIVLKRKTFFAETQMIGNFSYIVGYRPLISENGSIIGVVSIPSLYQQSEIDEEITKRNVYLYGAYAISLGLSIIIGTLIANRISSPIRRLRNAAQKISSGQLEIDLDSKRHDEVGELERAFIQMTHDLKSARDQTIKTQRETAWKEMAKQVAHEIKNPLTPMKLSVQHLRQAYKDGIKNFDDVLQRVTKTILEQIEVLSRIASEFSHYARMPERKLEDVDIQLVLQEAIILFQQHEDILFDIKFDNASSVVIADKEELRRAFINIIRNAVQAIEGKGTISIKTKFDIDITEITIHDTGQGMSEETLNRIFEPNFSTKTDGMGLGLAIVKKTIDELGGTIVIDSTIAEGTTVMIRLPLR